MTFATDHARANEQAPARPIPLERRRSERQPTMGVLDAVCSDGTAPIAAIRLSLLDESDGGLAAMTDSPISPGARLRVRICPQTSRWRDAIVMRCAPEQRGYRLGVRFERRHERREAA